MNLDDVDAALDSLIRPSAPGPLAAPPPEAPPPDEAAAAATPASGALSWPGRSDFGDLFEADWGGADPLPLRGSFDEKIAYFRDRVKRAEVLIERQRTAWQTRQNELDLLERLLGASRAEARERSLAQQDLKQAIDELTKTQRTLEAQQAEAVRRAAAAAERQLASKEEEHAKGLAQATQQVDALRQTAERGAADLQAAQGRIRQQDASLHQLQQQVAAQKTQLQQAHAAAAQALADSEARQSQFDEQAQQRQVAHAAELALRDRGLAELREHVEAQRQKNQGEEERIRQLEAAQQHAKAQHDDQLQALRDSAQQQVEAARAGEARALAEVQASQRQLAEQAALLEQEQNGHRRAVLELQASGAQRLAMENAIEQAREAAQQQRSEAAELEADLRQAVSTRDATLLEYKAQHQADLQRLQRQQAELEELQQRFAGQQHQMRQQGARRTDVLARSRRALSLAQEILGPLG